MKITPSGIIVAAEVSGAIAVSMGAFGAHALAERVTAGDMEIWKTAAQYHLAHSVLLAGVGVAAASIGSIQSAARRLLTISAALLIVGMLIFSGSLYLLVLSQIRWLGAITPIGGLSLIAAWLALAASGWKLTRAS